jgi:NADH-quinone oxidoreductase subunit M
MILGYLEILILIPLVAAVAILLGLQARPAAILAAAVNLLWGCFVWANFDASQPKGLAPQMPNPERIIFADPKIALSLGVDGMSLVLVMLTVIVTLAAVWIQPGRTLAASQARLYYASPLLIGAGALGAFLSTDLFFFFAFHELALVPTFLMIGMMGHGEDRMGAAWKITIYLSVGSLVLLAGLLALVGASGANSFSMADLQAAAAKGVFDPATQKWIYLTLLIGFGILIALFPFHSWAAPAYAAAPSPVAMMHAGVLKKFGLYGLLRVALPLLPLGHQAWANWVMVLLLGNILYVGLITIAQDRLDKMLGYSSVMHMGYVFLGIVSANPIGLNGAVLLMFAHGVSIALLFALTGELRKGIPALDMTTMGGLGRTAPVLCFLFAFAAFASIGLPGFANFASEVMVFFGGFSGYHGGPLGFLQVTTVLALWGVVISAVYMLRAFRHIFQGEAVASRTLADVGLSGRLAAGLLVLVLLVAGVVPSLILDVLPGSVQVILGQR